MSPMDEYGWFLSPVESVFTGLNTYQQVAKANPQRVALLFGGFWSSISQFLPGWLTTDANAQTNQGMPIWPNHPQMQLLQKTHGPLCQCAWYCTSSDIGFQLTVIELVLRDWPRSGFKQL